MDKWNDYSGQGCTPEEFKQLVEEALPLSKPSWVKGFMFHNTGRPTLAEVLKTPDANRDKNVVDDRMRNVASGYDRKGWTYIKNGQRETRGPHLFSAPDGKVYLGTFPTQKGIHSPGKNDSLLAGEMFGDYRSGSDEDDGGLGLVVKDTMCRAVAVVFMHWGIEATPETIWLHKEDPRTTHDCPGNDIEKADLIERVQRHMADLSLGGELAPASEPEPEVPAALRIVVVNVEPTDVLNLRDAPSAAGRMKGKMPRGTKLEVLDEAKNASSTWFRIRTPMGYEGWVNGKFVALPAETQPKVIEAPAPSPPPDDGIPILKPGPVNVLEPGLAVVRDHNDVAMALFTGLPFLWKGEGPRAWAKDYGFEPYDVNQAAGFTGNLMRESYARMETAAIGDQGTAFGVGQWRNERQTELRKFASQHGRSADDLILQLLYAMHELQVDDETDEVYAGKLLRAARTLEEATAAGVVYERPKGWRMPKPTTYDLAKILPAARKGDGWAVRLANGAQMVKEYEAIKGKTLVA